MKQICSNYPYEAKSVAAGSVAEDCLKTEPVRIRSEVMSLLQSKVSEAGLLIRDYQFNEISYAPEIASQMLVRQQAEAMLDARKVVVEGAVAIAADAILRLKEHGLAMAAQEANRLAANLIITICSESRVTPTINLATTV
jgi:chorismate synthase